MKQWVDEWTKIISGATDGFYFTRKRSASNSLPVLQVGCENFASSLGLSEKGVDIR